LRRSKRRYRAPLKGIRSGTAPTGRAITPTPRSTATRR